MIRLILTCLLASCAVPGSPIPSQKVVLVVSDDLGYGDLRVPTPAIDSLRTGGVEFTNAYAAAPCCAPDRACLESGVQGPRFGFDDNYGDAASWAGLPIEQPTIPERLGPGVPAARIGKWHLGTATGLSAAERGYSFVSDGNSSELSAAFAEFAAGKSSYFAALCFNEVHKPLVRREPWYSQLAGMGFTEKERMRMSMLQAMDFALGECLALAPDALVIFISDNGAPQGYGGSNAPLKGWKFDLWEGGIKVRCFMRRPGIQPGTTYTPIIGAMDIHATIMASFGNPWRGEGYDLIPALVSNSPVRDELYWRYNGIKAVRQGDWKARRVSSNPWQLYNLATDPAETTNVARLNPAIRDMLANLWTTWNAGNIPPLW